MVFPNADSNGDRHESAIASKGQATIPKAIREHRGLRPGDRIKFFVHPDGRVVIALREGRGSFADAPIGALGRPAGCTFTATFDRKALRRGGFVLPEDADR